MTNEITSDMLAELVWDCARYAASEGRKGRDPIEVADECTARWEAVRAKVAEARNGS